MHAKNLLLFDKQNIYHTEYLTICQIFSHQLNSNIRSVLFFFYIILKTKYIYLGIETVSCPLLQRKTKMYMD